MKPEDRLRVAAKAHTDPIKPAPDAWARIQARVDAEPSRHRRRATGRFALAGLATALAIALVAALVTVRGNDDGSRDIVAAPGEGQPPPQIVALTGFGRIVVFDTATGAEVRTLTDSADEQTVITATPDGERVFFDRPVPAVGDDAREVATVPTGGGDVEVFIRGAAQPAVSPDGALLAYTGSDPPSLGVVEIPDEFDGAVPDLVGDGVVGDGPEGWIHRGIGSLTWAPDSRHLLYLLASQPRASFRIAEVGPGVRLDEAPTVPISSATSRPCGFAYLGSTGLLVTTSESSVGGPDDLEVEARVVTVDPASGQEWRELFRVPVPFAGSCPPPASDATGEHVLAMLPARTAYRVALYRWNKGDVEATRIADDVVAAAWLPTGAQTAPDVVEPAPPTLPCGGEVPFAPTVLPDGFSSDPIPGPGTPSAVSNDFETAAIQHYTDGAGRVIEVHHPGTPIVTGDPPPAPSVTVLGRPGVVAFYAAGPVIEGPAGPVEPLVLSFSTAGDPETHLGSRTCASWSLDGYGVTEAELRAFAEGLVPEE